MKTLNHLKKMKEEQTKISMVTAYDFPSAKQVEQAEIDMILVGDSLGMTVLGYDSTVQVTVNDMIHHGKAVRRGAPNTFIVIDMPIGTVGVGDEEDLKNALKIYKDTNANAVKAEGAHLVSFIQKATRMGIPVVSHLGLTPQSVGVMGYKLQGDTKEAAIQLIEDAKAIEKAGAILLVLEAIPSDLAKVISEQLTIPVIGIGAGKDTDGQVLVYHDMLNYGVNRQAKFVKQFADFSIGIDGLKQYDQEVKQGHFPSESFTYKKKIMNEVGCYD
ncbi:3-methyl-2-oxobutanoate hydroxymethyltransferase [Staphylococcus saccharolyticus]|uniref:3-methyl-2-oxobutanoate hydroxymethyltransferase n=2 Tax=Staphylococcus saccharolyticus TaxID=33028 RepID=A0A380GXS7_9STAP|nr:3-methyl-2-oxobutanoate hydroxymethyltransferase [Staphylococcus saccharolyticus]MBL7564673.1 3-methyl-2-oxobutanoate hydroxymethyltransferase [Staphylococcus saccharolyticus]MBL7571063.1 3-methyl-2-oxobutanoate hydroxymethyltransferase [Staphylococcus saccharolyticus]QQB98912.1 3-methyl-2-oxobutanoate hydroxymethyltransferase [Staphylococcus saccharolyticus]QRJ66875.1 3-methyl-2-oxobutanoate hydroxymethyltransferase [Staphylococcus saccharolyticus]RTX98388.1 3-methyl-2-oxobutanoate hydroxy